MKLVISKAMVFKLLKLLKWGKIVAKLAALSTVISGAVAALTGSATTGAAVGAAGTAGFVAVKGMPTQGYDKTTHVPPAQVNRAANLMMKQQQAEMRRFMDRNIMLGIDSGNFAMREGISEQPADYYNRRK